MDIEHFNVGSAKSHFDTLNKAKALSEDFMKLSNNSLIIFVCKVQVQQTFNTYFIRLKNYFFVYVLFLFLGTLLSHVDHKHKSEPIDNLNKGDNTEAQVESKNPSKTCHKVSQS